MNHYNLEYATAKNLPSKKLIEEGIKKIDDLLSTDNHKNLSFEDLKKFFFECFTTIPVVMNLKFPYIPNVYRARFCSEVKDNTEKAAFSYPKPDICINAGRAHLAGFPVFYGSLSANVAAMEIESQVGDTVFLGKWKIKESARLNSLHFLFDSDASFGAAWKDINESIVAKYNDSSQCYPQDTQEAMKMLCTKISQLFTSRDYAISSFLGHYYLYDAPNQEPKADVIIYPSLRSLDNGVNFAFAPSFVNENLILEEVQDITITELSNDGVRFNLNYHGIPAENNRINWYKPELRKDEITVLGVTFHALNKPDAISTETSVFVYGQKKTFHELARKLINNEDNGIDDELAKKIAYDTFMIPQEDYFDLYLPENSCFIELNEKKQYLKSIAVGIKYHIELIEKQESNH